MEKNFKRLCTALLTTSILLTLASCGDNKTSENNTTTTESTTIVATKTPEKTTGDSTTTTHSTTKFEETKTTEVTTKTDKTETSQEKPAQVKPTEPKNKPTQVKPTESNTKPTEAKPQKTTPKFIFTQSLPVKVTAFNAEFEVVKANTADGYWYNEDTYLFDINITVKRCDDGINEEKASAVQMTIKDSNGNVVRSTSTSAGMLSIGEQGTGCMAWSVDAPGTYTIEFSSI